MNNKTNCDNDFKKYLTIRNIIDFELGNEKEFIFSLKRKNGTNKVPQRIELQESFERIGTDRSAESEGPRYDCL